jgi:hypothetical protein
MLGTSSVRKELLTNEKLPHKELTGKSCRIVSKSLFTLMNMECFRGIMSCWISRFILIIMHPKSGKHIELQSSLCLSVRLSVCVLQILWHQLLINYQVDFFQTCTDDQAGCLDDHKETIFPATFFTTGCYKCCCSSGPISVRGHILVIYSFCWIQVPWICGIGIWSDSDSHYC